MQYFIRNYQKSFSKNLVIYNKITRNVSLLLKHNSVLTLPHCEAGSCFAAQTGRELKMFLP